MLKKLILTMLASSALTAANAQTEINWWHAMTGANNDVIVRLATEFNESQKDYKIVVAYKGSYAETLNAGIAAFRAGQSPHILQVFEVGTGSMMAAKGAIKPVSDLMKEAGENFSPDTYLAAIRGYYSTLKGDMLSMPFNSSSAILWINKTKLKEAGLNPDQPPKTYDELIKMAKVLKEKNSPTCGFSTAWVTWLNIEQLSSWHNVPLSTKANGMDGYDTSLTINSPFHIRHLNNLIEWQKDKTYDYSGRTNTGEGRFTSGECPLFMTSSAFFGNIKANAKFEFTSAPMPYYPDMAGAPQNSIIGGASLWAMGGKTAVEYKGVAKFFTFLSDVDRQVKLHTQSGYLPITNAAYEKTKASGFYKENPYMETPILQLNNKAPTENSRGLRLGNLVPMRDVWAEEVESALQGKKAAKEALDAAVTRGNEMLRTFERTVQR